MLAIRARRGDSRAPSSPDMDPCESFLWGYLMEVVLGLGLSQVQGLHSHLEPLHRVRAGQGLVTASYSQDNSLHIGQDTGADPTGFIRLHQLLHQEKGIDLP